MPYSNEFLKGFKVKRGMIIGGYKLKSIQIGHESIVRFKEYRYPMTLTFESVDDENPNTLLKEFKEYVSEDQIIYSQYRNPYDCSFGKPIIDWDQSDPDNGIIVITSEGIGIRNYELPKKGE